MDKEIQDVYFQDLKLRYQFLKQKFQLKNQGVLPVHFFRLRPPNFPTIRLSQLAQLYHCAQNLFSKLMACKTKNEIYTLFNISTSRFWETHYTFEKTSKKRTKKISESFVDLLIINTIIPLKFCYSKSLGKSEPDHSLNIIKTLNIEKNSITNKFMNFRNFEENALTSQSLIQLKTENCDKNKCLQCAIGSELISKNR